VPFLLTFLWTVSGARKMIANANMLSKAKHRNERDEILKGCGLQVNGFLMQF
jgi:hypothetical protein